MNKKTLLIIPIIFLAFALMGLASATPYCRGATYNFTCGGTINQSCTFDSDMNCGILGGLTVRDVGMTGNMVVNCAGKKFTGNGMASGFSLNGGDQNITIKNCDIENWGRPIDITNSIKDNIWDNNISNYSVAGIDVENYGENKIYRNKIDGSDLGVAAYGIYLEDGNTPGLNDIQDNVISNTGAGMYINCPGNVIDNLTVQGTFLDGVEIDGADAYLNTLTNSHIDNASISGVYIENSADNNSVTYTNITNTYGIRSVGIIVSNADSATLDHNNIINNTGNVANDGILLTTSSFNNVTNNTIFNVTGNGIDLEYNSDNNTLDSNAVTEGDNTGSQTGIIMFGGCDNNKVWNNNVTGYLNSTFGSQDTCVISSSSDYNEISVNNLNNCNRGVYVTSFGGGQGTYVFFNKISCNNSLNSEGVWFEGNTGGSADSNQYIIENNISNCYRGIYTYYQVMGEVIENRIVNATGMAPIGITIDTDGMTIVQSNYIDNLSGSVSIGLLVLNSSLLDISTNNISRVDTGMYFNEANGFVASDGNKIINTGRFDLYSEEMISPEILTNITTDNGLIDILNFSNISLKDTASYPTLPSGKSALVVYHVTNTSQGAYMDLNISYDDQLINESTLDMWAYRSSWNKKSNSVDIINNIVYADNITSFSYFAPLYATLDNSPVASLGNPADGSTQTTNTVYFGLKCSDDVGVSQLQIWINMSGAWHKLGTKNNPGNNTWWNYTLTNVPNGYYIWGAWCNDSIGQENWSGNYTITINKSSGGSGGGGGGGGGSCGDGTCSSNENCGTCVQDCGCSSGYVCQNDQCVSPQVCCEYFCFIGCSYKITSLKDCTNVWQGKSVTNTKCQGQTGFQALQNVSEQIYGVGGTNESLTNTGTGTGSKIPTTTIIIGVVAVLVIIYLLSRKR